MGKVNQFEDLKCWQEARLLVKLTYDIIRGCSSLSKDFDTSSQIRRAAISVMNNISEGFGRYYRNDMIRFLNIAQSSALEVKSMTYILEDNFEDMSKNKILELRDRSESSKRLILAFIKYLSSDLNKKADLGNTGKLS